MTTRDNESRAVGSDGKAQNKFGQGSSKGPSYQRMAAGVWKQGKHGKDKKPITGPPQDKSGQPREREMLNSMQASKLKRYLEMMEAEQAHLTQTLENLDDVSNEISTKETDDITRGESHLEGGYMARSAGDNPGRGSSPAEGGTLSARGELPHLGTPNIGTADVMHEERREGG